MSRSAPLPFRRAPRQRAAGALLVVLLLGWLTAGLHFALEAHDHDTCAEGWVHRDAALLDLCCDHIAADRGAAPWQPDPAGEVHAAEFAGHGHLCAVVDLLVPLHAGGAARHAAKSELRLSPSAQRLLPAVEEREPRYRLAPKGSPPVVSLGTA